MMLNPSKRQELQARTAPDILEPRWRGGKAGDDLFCDLME
jgi:hypothetical protein